MSKRKAELPKLGDKIPSERFFVSDTNVRKGHPFGDSEADKNLIQDLRRAKDNKPVHPFKARPEGDGYGVYAGRRKLLALKTLRKEFVIGVHGVVDDVSDEEAISASWTENRTELQEQMDPITYAKGLNRVLSFSPLSLRKWAEAHNMSPSTVSERLRVLELSPKMQEVTANRKIFYYDALQIAKMKLGKEVQDQLAELVEKDGYDVFKAELKRRIAGKGKRGIPADRYWIDRLAWDKRNLKHQRCHDILTKVAEAERKTVPEYILGYIITNIDEIAKELA